MMMEADDGVSGEAASDEAREPAPVAGVGIGTGAGGSEVTAVRIEPDLEFLRALERHTGGTFKKCIQCGTCSVACDLSPDISPFPRKEVAWALWGFKERLLGDPDVWLCHQCHDCSTRCPRDCRPGDILAAVRSECVKEFAAPAFLGRWMDHPQYLLFLLAIPALLLSLSLLAGEWMAGWFDITRDTSEKVIFTYTSILPHWVINTFFGFFSILTIVASVFGVRRFWAALVAGDPRGGEPAFGKTLPQSILATFRRVFTHEDFTACAKERTRSSSHLLVVFGFLALGVVAFWVVVLRINPFVGDGMVYPFNFWSPWKILANIGGGALLAGCGLMIFNRLKDGKYAGANRYSDWFLIVTLTLVVVSGFACEVTHFIRLEPHRHAIYFAHLVLIFTLLMYLPYSKLAHVIYRTTAMVFAEYTGRNWGVNTGETASVSPRRDV
jgi:quinone-modifying oxidoreductase, subunit QmoC